MKDSLSFWCFSCFSLFNLQGTNRSPAELFQFTRFTVVCQALFQTFFAGQPGILRFAFSCCHSHNVLGKRSIRKTVAWTVILMCRHYLSSRAVASQVFSAQVSLTAVFGMGTGGPSLQSAPTIQFPKTWPPWTNQQGVCPWKRKSNVGNELSR